MLRWLLLLAAAADARPKPNTKPDTLFKGPGVTILDRQGVQAIRNDKSGATGWVVAFYAPWCGHCRHYAPEFKKFGAALQGRYPNIKAGAVSCTAERKACDENQVKGYPTVKSFGALGHDIVLKRHQSKDLLELVRSKQTDAAFAGLVKPKWGAEPPEVISAPTPQSPYDKIMATAKPPPKLRAAPSTIDAAASFRFMLENAFVGSQILTEEKSVALRGLLAAVARASPEITVAGAVATCLQQQPSPTSTDWAAWLEEDGVVKCHDQTTRVQRKRWTSRCDPDGKGVEGTAYTCGLWGLFHGLVQSLSARDGLSAVRASMHFFGCEECRDHFLEMYDSCRYGRCDADADASLWLWRAHNVVNARTHGHVEDGYITSNTPNNAAAFWAWPSPEQCTDCRDGKKWDLDGVRAFLKREYGRDGAPSASGVSRRGRALTFILAGRRRSPRRRRPARAFTAF
jgi:thiol oxidase